MAPKLFVPLLFVIVAVQSIPLPTSEDYTHNVVLDSNENYHVYWKFDDEKITFEVHVRTTGWVGFGFSPNGGMPGSDMVVGWVLDNGEVKFTDRHAKSKSEPIVDDQQDYRLLLGKEEDDFTILKFERLIDTCDDEHDWLITSDTSRMIWAYHSRDPEDDESLLRHTHRGSKSLRLFTVAGESDPDLGGDVVTYDLLNQNYLIPAKHTTYFCLGYKLPELDSKHHMIAYEPVIQAGNEAFVHHITAYQCRVAFNETAHHGSGHECYNANMPQDWNNCNSAVIAWAIGGEEFYFPEHAGFSLGDVGDPTFLMLEIHYDNPEEINNIYDSSGIRIFYTPTLRLHDAGVLGIAQDVSIKQVIPPGAENFRNYAYCLAELTKEGFVDHVTGQVTDVNVFAVELHTHLIGKSVGVRHLRRGKELGVILKDDHYDFNYQEMHRLSEEVVLKPGDDVVVECVYDSTDRINVTYGGLPTTNEMCFAFLYVYPRIAVDYCFTFTEANETAAAVGIEEVTQDWRNPTVISPPKWAGWSLTSVLDITEWTAEAIERLQRANEEGYQRSSSLGGIAPNVFMRFVFHKSIGIVERLPTPQRECDVTEPTISLSTIIAPDTIVITVFAAVGGVIRGELTAHN